MREPDYKEARLLACYLEKQPQISESKNRKKTLQTDERIEMTTNLGQKGTVSKKLSSNCLHWLLNEVDTQTNSLFFSSNYHFVS